jgi:hypothetical protein
MYLVVFYVGKYVWEFKLFPTVELLNAVRVICHYESSTAVALLSAEHSAGELSS